jgi:hypothetical protein
VTMVHVVCSPTAEVIRGAFEEAQVPASEATGRP